jgi:hypothetical protein
MILGKKPPKPSRTLVQIQTYSADESGKMVYKHVIKWTLYLDSTKVQKAVTEALQKIAA